MNWEFVGAVAGVLALAVTVFLEWPKLMERLVSIPPVVFVILFLIFLFILGMITAVIFFWEEGLLQWRGIAIVSNLFVNIIFIAVGNYSKRFATDEIDKGAIFWIISIFIYFEVVFAYLGVVNPFGWP